MKNEKMYDGITGIREEFIEQAENYKFKRVPQKISLAKWGIMVACLGVICVMIGVLPYFRGENTGFGGGGEVSDTVFMSYEGPILPLSSLTDTSGILVERDINFDFSPYETTQHFYENENGMETYEDYETKSIISDCYTLNNTTNEDIVLTAVYGFPGSFTEKIKNIPVITVNGAKVETKLYAGKYSGDFQSVDGSNNPEERINLENLDRWEEYQELLSDGVYLQDALAAYPELNQKVTVYELTNLAYTGNDETAVNPSMDFSFKMDTEKTTIMTYGSNGGASDMETGEYHRMFDIQDSRDTDKTAVLIVLGEDITDINLQAYKKGMYEEGEELEGATVKMERYETTLNEIIWRTIIDTREASDSGEEILLDDISDEMLFGSMAELMYDYGLLSGDVAERYEFGMLEDIEYESTSMKRVLYLTFEIVVPANASVQVEAYTLKEASFDYHGTETDRNGFDMMTGLGSAFEFLSQKASISNTEFIEVVGQNFGFDLENGITEVELDMNEPHYYIEVRKIPDENK